MIIRREQRIRFTIVDNASIEDPRLTFKAVGLLTYLLSKPDGWTANYRQLAAVRKDGEASVQAGLKELREAGYLEQKKYRKPDGLYAWECIIHEQPCGGFPGVDKPGVDNPRNSKDLEAKNPLTPKRGERRKRRVVENECRRDYDSTPMTPEEIAAKWNPDLEV